MSKIQSGLKRLAADQQAATAIEYGLIMALMAIAIIGALASTGNSNKDKWDGVANKVVTATN